MNKQEKFLNFLQNLNNTSNTAIIESISTAFLLLESAENETHECKIEFTCSNREGSLEKILDVYNGDQSGILVLDQEECDIPPVTHVYNSNPVGGNRTSSIEYDISADGISTIIVRASDKDRLENTRDSIKTLLQNLGELGNGGHSYDIRFYPNNTQAKMKRFGWDGDGSDRIDLDSIKVKKL